MISNLWIVAILIANILLMCLVYLGIGFVTYLATVSDDEVHWKFNGRAKIILGWPRYAIRILLKGMPKID